MSIIYDALQKIGNKDNTPLDTGKVKIKKKGPNLFIPAIFFIALIIFVFTAVVPKFKKQAVSVALAPALKPQALSEDIQGDNLPLGEFNLEGIIYSQDDPIAIINGKILRRKDKIDDFQVKEITPNGVELINSSDNTPLNLSLK